MRCLRSLLLPLFLLVAAALPARAQGTRIKDLPLTTSIPADGRIALDASTFTALRGISVQQLATNLGTLAVANKLNTTNGVAVNLTTPTAATSSNDVVNKTSLDAAIVAGVAAKLNTTNGVAVGLTTTTAATAANDVVNKTALDAAIASDRSFALTSSGLILSVAAGNLTDGDGNPIPVAAGTVRLRPSVTNIVVVDLHDLSLHAFTRAWHVGGVAIGTVITSSTNVTSITQPRSFALRENPLMPVLAKIRGGAPWTCIRVGDSINGGAGTSPYWYSRSFDTAQSSGGYNVTNIANATFRSLSFPGSSAIGGKLLTAQLGTQPGYTPGFGFDHVDQTVWRFPWINSQLSSPETGIGPHLLNVVAPDVVVIAFGTNHEVRNMRWLSEQIAYWVDAGSAVVLLTCNRRYDGGSSATIDDARWQTIAQAHGAVLCDTAEFVEEAYRNYLSGAGSTPYVDGVHHDTGGSIAWARAVSGIFRGYTFPYSSPAAANRRQTLTSSDIRPASGGYLQLVNNQSSGTSTVLSTQYGNNIRYNLAGTSWNSGITSVPTNAYVVASHPFMSGSLWAITENQGGDPYSFSFAQQGSTTITTGTDSGLSVWHHFTEIATDAQIQAFQSSQYTTPRTKGLPVSIGGRFGVTAGTAKLVGFYYETPRIRPIDIPFDAYHGSWFVDDGDYNLTTGSGPVVMTSNTTGDFVEFTTPPCDMVSVVLRGGQSAGQYDVSIDGITAYTALEGYRGVGSTGLVLPITLAPGIWPTAAGASGAASGIDGLRKPHTVRIKLSGVNGSAAAVATGAGRLTILYAVAMDSVASSGF